MEAGKFSFKFSRQTQKNLVGSSKYAYFNELAHSRPTLVGFTRSVSKEELEEIMAYDLPMLYDPNIIMEGAV
jgi:hypothetical protein